MRKLHEPLTLPKHPELLRNINQLSIDIKLTHLADDETKKKLEDDGRRVTPPTWQYVVGLLREAYQAINEQRENPIKY